jgi:hypothetical protein
MYSRIPWELVTVPTGFTELTLGTTDIVNMFWNDLDIGTTVN